jgi:uncharacterized membrane protein YgdD (TMEM256/DUF423 family)
MNKKIVLSALIFGILSIILGAFGAHALKKVLTLEQLVSFETGVRYMMYHALFLLFVGSSSIITEAQKKAPFYFTLFGTIFFSGSLFLLTTSAITGIDFKFLGPITPIGGLFLIAAWASFFFASLKKK